MTPPQLKYFEGWRDACEDVAKFLEQLHANSPEQVKFMTECYLMIAKSVREKGQLAHVAAVAGPVKQ